MQVAIGGEAVQHCTPPLSNSSLLSREYDGISVYSPPSICSLDYPILTVVHGDLHTSSCTAEELPGDKGLSATTVGLPAKFQVVARDAFGNIRFERQQYRGGGSRVRFIAKLAALRTLFIVLAPSEVGAPGRLREW